MDGLLHGFVCVGLDAWLWSCLVAPMVGCKVGGVDGLFAWQLVGLAASMHVGLFGMFVGWLDGWLDSWMVFGWLVGWLDGWLPWLVD